ncbi:hypothetical protein VTO42DRAFT_1052 [Malbranchea cinnamomea]
MASNEHQRLPGNKEFSNVSVVVIGGGISGLCTGIELLKYNIRNFVILEKSAGLGGTWRDNKYPGCCCDVNSHLYSFSFEQNPNWTRLYPGQEEILDYLYRVSGKYGLTRYIRFSSFVDEARWDDEARKWKTHVKVTGAKDAEFVEEYTITSDFLVSAVGQLNYPHYPSIEGLNDFKGKMMHSARWDWSYDLKGKKVGIIGNGASAAQIIPEIAPDVSHLTIFQRTPNWIIPRQDMQIWKPVRTLFKLFPPLLWKFRSLIMDLREAYFAAIVDPTSKWSNWLRDESITLMKQQLPGRPDLWEKLTPNYPPGCKRIIITDDYFPTLRRDNVTLETGRIDRITEKGIVVDGVEHEFDLIILATGFRTVEFMHPIKVYGANGTPLSEVWKNGARALYGVTVESLPNFGILYGPNTNLGHNSIILMIEAQARYIRALIQTVLRARQAGGSLAITPRKERLDEFNHDIQAALAKSSFAHPNCQSWYKRDDGLITNNWSSTVVDYQKLLSKIRWDDFNFDGTGPVAVQKKESRDRKAVKNIGRVREESLVGLRALIATFGVVGVLGILNIRAPHLLSRVLKGLSGRN